MRRRLATLRGPTGLLLLVVVLAYIGPRLYLYRGIPITTNFTFADMIYHVYHLDIETKKRILPDRLSEDRYLKQFPELTTRIHPYRWPGLVYYLGIPWAAAFGALSTWTIQLTNAGFMLLLLWAVVGLGRALPGGRTSRLGLWAALLTVLCPALFASTWYYSLDFPLVGFCLLALYLLWRSEGFTRPLATAGFAVCSGLGIYVKFSFALYLVVPSALALSLGLWRGPRLRALAGALGAIAVGCAFFFAAFSPSFEEIWGEFYNHAFSRELPAAAIPPGSEQWWLSQPIFAALNFPWPLLLLVVPGLLLAPFAGLLRRRGRPQPPAGQEAPQKPAHPFAMPLILAYLWGSVALLTLMSNKLERYLHPVYPVLCLLGAWWVAALLPRRIRAVGLGLLALAFAGTLAYTQVDPTPWHTGADNARPSAAMWNEYAMPGLKRLAAQRQDPYLSHCHFREMVDQIVAWAEQDRSRRPVGMAHLRTDNSGGKEVPFGELLLLVSYRLQDRFVVSGGLYGMERLPGPLGHAPNLIIVHPPGEDPRTVHPELRPVASQTFRLRCQKTNPEFALSLYHHE